MFIGRNFAGILHTYNTQPVNAVQTLKYCTNITGTSQVRTGTNAQAYTSQVPTVLYKNIPAY